MDDQLDPRRRGVGRVGHREVPPQDVEALLELGAAQGQAGVGASVDGELGFGHQIPDPGDVAHDGGATDRHAGGQVVDADRHECVEELGHDVGRPDHRVVERRLPRDARPHRPVAGRVGDQQAVAPVSEGDRCGGAHQVLQGGDLVGERAPADNDAVGQVVGGDGAFALELREDACGSAHGGHLTSLCWTSLCWVRTEG